MEMEKLADQVGKFFTAYLDATDFLSGPRGQPTSTAYRAQFVDDIHKIKLIHFTTYWMVSVVKFMIFGNLSLTVIYTYECSDTN